MKKIIFGFLTTCFISGCGSQEINNLDFNADVMQPQVNTLSKTDSVDNATHKLQKVYFDFLDKNGDDNIVQKELNSYFTSQGKYYFPKLDQNRDKKITRHEFYENVGKTFSIDQQSAIGKARINWEEMIGTAGKYEKIPMNIQLFKASMNVYLAYSLKSYSYPPVFNVKSPEYIKEKSRFQRFDRDNDLFLTLDEFEDLTAYKMLEYNMF